MERLLERRFRRNVVANEARMKRFSDQLKGITIIRSIELIGVAYKLRMLEDYVPTQKYGRRVLVDALLWAAKTNGCAVTEHEIEELKSYLLK